MTTYDPLAGREFTTVPMPFATYCAVGKCQTLILPNTPVKKYDGATFAHVNCPKTNHRTFAAHKQPNTGMKIS